jgi:hypothetical protein
MKAVLDERRSSIRVIANAITMHNRVDKRQRKDKEDEQYAVEFSGKQNIVKQGKSVSPFGNGQRLRFSDPGSVLIVADTNSRLKFYKKRHVSSLDSLRTKLACAQAIELLAAGGTAKTPSFWRK